LADIVLINPRFEISFWGFECALPLFGKRANMTAILWRVGLHEDA
jgi:hypothetical protein